MGETPLVLVHGLSETRSAWRRQTVAFSADFATVVAYDVRGFGSSPAGRCDGTVEQFADDLAQLVSAFGGGPANVVGFSMGGVIAQRFALDHPELAERLVLVASSSTVGSAAAEWFEERLSVAEAQDAERLATLNATDARSCIGSGGEGLREEYERLRTEAVTSMDGYANACRAMRRLRDEPLTPHLGQVPHPTLVLAADGDPYCPPRAAEMIASAMPSASLSVFEGVGHCIHWEAEDEFNDRVRRFLHGR